MNRRHLLLAGTLATLCSPGLAARKPAVGEPGDEVIDLWPGDAPGGERVTAKEEVIERLPDGPMRDRYVQHVTRPTMTLFKPKIAFNGITLLIVPGGGYVRVVVDKEGVECADWFTERGFAAAVLRYRLPGDRWAAGPDVSVHDAMRALRLLRARAAKLENAPARFGVIGFSAGGHLCARLLADTRISYKGVDSADDLSARPDFGVLMYPVIAMSGPYAHQGSVNQLLAGTHGSGSGSPVNQDGFAPHLRVGSETPPTMLVHAADDTGVPVENSLMMYDALRKAKVRSELHVFDSGGHGFGLRGVAGRNVAAWPTLVQNWAINHAKATP